MKRPRNNDLIHNARVLRKNMTKEERHLWYDLLRYCSPRFRRQEIIGNYIADFYCHQAKLIIELDGSQHLEPDQIAYDAQRTAYFQSLGIQVIRYYNTDVSHNFDGVCQDIWATLNARGIALNVTFDDDKNSDL